MESLPAMPVFISHHGSRRKRVFSVRQNSWQLTRCCAIQSSAFLTNSLSALFCAKERIHDERLSGGTDSGITDCAGRALFLYRDRASARGCDGCSHAL